MSASDFGGPSPPKFLGLKM